MKVGFISPSFRVLEINWNQDYEMVKLGVPTLMGHLYRAGHTDISHWDFDAQICEAVEADPASFDLRQYFDREAVAGFIAGTDDRLRAQTEKILDTLGVTEREAFGISLSAVIDRIANVIAIAAVGQCLARVLKERYPGCAVVFGGLQASPMSLHEGLYRQFMEECPFVDYSFLNQGDANGVQLFRNITRGAAARSRRLSQVMYRGTDTDGRPVILKGEGSDIDRDLHTASAPRVVNSAHDPVPVHDPVTAQDAAGAVVIAAGSLLRRRPETAPVPAPAPAPVPVPVPEVPHPYDLDDDTPAAVAGPQEYEAVPANVPIFDKQLVDHFRFTGLQIMKRFHFDKEMLLRYSRHENDTVVVLPHIFVRGCNAPCGFCSYAYTKIQGEEIAQTVAGLRYLAETYDCRNFHFLNTQINSVYRYCEEFCDQLIAADLDLRWSDCANMRALDEPLLEKLRRAGAMRLVFGVEAPEDSMLKYIHKGIKTAKVERLLKASHDLGIWNHVLLIAGMPHETPAKQDRMMDFLVRTAPTVDFFSISSFYLIASSPWGKDPAKFGIERLTDPNGLLEEQAFNEVADGRWESDNLRWPEKKRQIVESTERFYKTISGAKGQSRCVGGNIDLYLLMFLYRSLGFDRKAEIVKIYEDTARHINPTADTRADASGVSQDMFRVNIPVIVGRVNEGDQSQLSYIPFDVVVARREETSKGFCASERFTFAYRTPKLDEDGRMSSEVLATFRDNWPRTVQQLVTLLGPFLKALDTRLAPATPERMAELVAKNLPRYKPFSQQGFMVAGPPGAQGRTPMERSLQWSGLAS